MSCPASRRRPGALHLARPPLSRSPPPTGRSASIGEWWRRRQRAGRGPRLFPGRGRGRRPLLAVPQGRRRGRSDRRPQLAPARGVRDEPMSNSRWRRHFSFLRGVSSAEELFAAATLLGYPALGIADRNTVGGLVKALGAERATGVRLVAGCRLDLMDGTSLLVWPEDRAAWSRLTRLLTSAKAARSQEGRERAMLPPLGG